MDSVALAVLLTDLFMSIHNLGGYPMPATYPAIHQVSPAELQQRFCGRPCSIKAYYLRDEGVFIDDTLDIEFDEHARSILLHELVHHLQAQNGRFDGARKSCLTSDRAEAEAYALQNEYLESIHSTHRIALSGWAGRCRKNNVPGPAQRI